MKNAPAFTDCVTKHPHIVYPALCLLAGSLSSLAMAPANMWFILFAGFGTLYISLCHSQGWKMLFACGWLFTFGYHLFGLSWVGNALLVDGNPYKWAWPLAVAGLPFILAFFGGVATLVAGKISSLKTASGFLAFVASITASEWLRGHLFTGFPWNLYGYTWVDILPLIQITFPTDSYMLTGLTVLWTTAPAFLIAETGTKRTKILTGTATALLFISCYAYGATRLENTPTTFHDDFRIRLANPYIPQHEKWDRNKIMENFFRYIRSSYPDPESAPNADANNAETTTTYIIWPETALNHWIAQDRTSLSVISETLRSYKGDAYIMTGLLRPLGEQEFRNSLVMIDKDGTIFNAYDKHHLVPFGEYIPFKDFIPLAPINRFSGFVAGESLKTLPTPEGMTYSPLVCYESVFPGQSVDRQQGVPDIMINVSNDAWYGNSAGPKQSFVQSLFRTVEEGIPMARAANGGVSAMIDPLGRTLYRTNPPQENAGTIALPEKVLKARLVDAIKTPILWGLVVIMLVFGHRNRAHPTHD